MCNQIMKKEVQEAIRAGEQVLQSLYYAGEKLENAGKWGIFAMFAGGFFSGYMKHSRIKEAEALLEQAKTELQLFQYFFLIFSSEYPSNFLYNSSSMIFTCKIASSISSLASEILLCTK